MTKTTMIPQRHCLCEMRHAIPACLNAAPLPVAWKRYNPR
ncbi:hypothetical protein EDWATA_02750 [Edwardsiella tarda ATCC 23685]|uniref:Uncharacterized protein n=1 Tax=Edwardsiella tarda ATCC 23685 TaxID=500638 RepID=D4F7L4_EDWTA|nr:hypothetical protein EDWATA_02750 [Edwardsiella tarda ATCC 23685]